jgi:hypothetical protein
MSLEKYVLFSSPQVDYCPCIPEAKLSAQRDWQGWPDRVTGWPGPGEPLPAKHPLVRP